MAIESSSWQRDWTVAPGEVLLEALEDRDMSQSELARRMGRPTKTINEIVNGKAAITPDTAIQLELTLGISASFWNNLEAAYREEMARVRSETTLAAHASWAKAFPIKDLVRHKLIERGATDGGTVGALLAFFRVSSPSAWEGQWLAPAASFRKSPAFSSSPYAAAAWLRWGETIAAQIETQPFDADRLRAALQEIRGLTRGDFALTRTRVQAALAEAGVALVLTPEFTGTSLSGAARWLSADKAVIQLSLRHKTDDQLWFSLFHEAHHLLGRKRDDFVDGADQDDGGQAEHDADCFARDTLIPPAAYAALVDDGSFTSEAVRAFAKEQGIAPGIVVGRLQRDDKLPPSHLHDLKRPIKLGAT